jgi:hypothetical protein
LSALPTSMTTSPGPRGQEPVFSRSGLSFALDASTLVPTLSRAAFPPSRP